ncbi:GNAT family N-acetyltransferase [Roseateles sp. DAIF2]|uniref:GNAT family N-acetyltransferase n=1 Tax=Roseateles sp. DAIF2 TaxID=2714952 RepID=UPI0018A2CC86|nr:GNAT family N-acetyltransferase [Roseateles sp. DAIF2]QPF72958.1 GNAT family N-acetyltransferase [Roseateles sp. DAIF2]
MAMPHALADIRIEPLVRHPALLSRLQAWMEAEWPGWYGPGGRGDARADLADFARAEGLPLGLLALRAGEPVGLAALKRAGGFAGLDLPGPWAAAGLVPAELRGRGIGRLLLAGLEDAARAQGFRTIFCGTASSASLLRRAGWSLRQPFDHEGQVLSIFEKAL